MYTLEVQGTLLEVRSVAPASEAPKTNAGRGQIQGFSRASRRRLIEMTARLEVDEVRTTFLTLTFGGMPTNDNAAAAFKRFRMRLTRKHPQLSGVWRKEYQERGSIHYHLILFRYPYTEQREIQRVWEECTREAKSIVHVKLLVNKRQAMYYVSKYIAKYTPEVVKTSLDNGAYCHADENLSVGRQWGYINKEALPYGEKRRIVIENCDALRYLLWAAAALSRGRARMRRGRAVLYSDQAAAMLEELLRLYEGDVLYDAETWMYGLRYKAMRDAKIPTRKVVVYWTPLTIKSNLLSTKRPPVTRVLCTPESIIADRAALVASLARRGVE